MNGLDHLVEKARELFITGPDWALFYKKVFGVGGFVQQHFLGMKDNSQFVGTKQYQELHQMLHELRIQGPPVSEEKEPTRVITVRLPKSMHEALIVEAHLCQTSLNQLCISKLVHQVDRNAYGPAAGKPTTRTDRGNSTPEGGSSGVERASSGTGSHVSHPERTAS